MNNNECVLKFNIFYGWKMVAVVLTANNYECMIAFLRRLLCLIDHKFDWFYYKRDLS